MICCDLRSFRKLKCEYFDSKQKELIINDKRLAITQKKYNKTYYNITNDSFKKLIINKLSNKNINIIEKYSIYNKKDHRELILNNNFIFSYKTKGNNYILFFTIIDNIKYI